MDKTHNLLLATDAIFDLRQWVTRIGLRNPAMRSMMDDLETRMLEVEQLVGEEADGRPARFGLVNEVRGLLLPVTRS
jgi:predicted ArsR family transcriptional regulator